MRYRKEFIRSGFSLGQIVNVVNNRKCYNLYEDMANKLQLSNFILDTFPSQHGDYRVIHITKHGYISNNIIITIRSLLDGHEFMMTHDGIRSK